MKKVILFLVPILMLLCIGRAHAAVPEYYIEFESSECMVPIGGDVIENIPEAYLYDSGTNQKVECSFTYFYGLYENKVENINVYIPGRYQLFVTAKCIEYFEYQKMTIIDVMVYDNTQPTITVPEEINCSYNSNRKLDSYYSITDDSAVPVNVEVIGDYNLQKIGEYNVTIIAKDSSNNASSADVKIIVSDKIAPKIKIKDDIVLEYGEEFEPKKYITVDDEYDGYLDFDCTSVNTLELGSQEVTVTAKDSSENVATKSFILTVEDNQAPTIILKSEDLKCNEDYDLLDNIAEVKDNEAKLAKENVTFKKVLCGTGRYLVTYKVKDNKNNVGYAYAYVNYEYKNKPVIEFINCDDITEPFDPLHYVKATDVEDGDITDKVMVIEVNYDEKYCIYEVCDSNGNYTRERVNFSLENVEEKKIVFPTEEIYETPEANDVEKKLNDVSKKNNYYIYYIVVGVVLTGALLFILIKHFKKKMV